MQDKKIATVEECLRWTERQMLTFDRGYWGVYERIRIDENERVCHCRPDCSTELMRVLDLYEKVTKNTSFDDVYQNQINWLQKVQNGKDRKNAGSFSFAFADGNRKYYEIGITFPNDNGKVLINLLELYEQNNDSRLLDMALPLADYWASIQTPKGNYYSVESKECMHNQHFGACFVLWMMAGMYKCYGVTKNIKYLKSGELAFSYLCSMIKNGRLLTSMEVDNDEFWRPASSENVIALYALSQCYRYHKDEKLKDAAYEILPYIMGLIDASTGAIKNCDKNSLTASENNDEMLCDLVYTEGFALNAFIEAYEVFGDKTLLSAAVKLGDWLASIQCKNENPLWDGAWRGAYSLTTKQWSGRGNQRNAILDEGGIYAVYTGWCAYPICMGLLKLATIK